ncbi:hypothetical protein D9M68_907240 [compost metagenome]
MGDRLCGDSLPVGFRRHVPLKHLAPGQIGGGIEVRGADHGTHFGKDFSHRRADAAGSAGHEDPFAAEIQAEFFRDAVHHIVP